MKKESEDQRKIKETAARVAAGITATKEEADAEWEKHAKVPAGDRVDTQPQAAQILPRLPRPMTRVSPFYPISRRQMAHRTRDPLVIDNGKYGKVKVVGQLSIFDETILLASLWLAKKNNYKRYNTTRYQLCKLTGVKPATNTYKAIRYSLENLYGHHRIVGEPEGKGLVYYGERILHYFKYWEESGKIVMELDKYFLEKYRKDYTCIDLKFRAKLKGDITKALYRFLLSHGKAGYKHKFEYPLLFLCQVINIEESLPEKKKRDHVRAALKELRVKGFLSNGRITKNNVVSGLRAGKSA